MKEAEMLGAKALTRRIVTKDTNETQPGVSVTFDAYRYLLNRYLDNIHTDSDIQKARGFLCETKEYRNFSSGRRVDEWMGCWEQVLTDALKLRKNKVFYATRAYGSADHFESESTHRDRPRTCVAVIREGLKARRGHNGIGELPELVVEWLKSVDSNIEFVRIENAEHQHQNLNQEQWDTALDLWYEAEMGSVYFDPKEAILAGAEL